MTRTYFLDPLDVLLFRDGRPRVTGDSHVMQGTFPPPPSALYGAFRSAVLAAAEARFVPGNAAAAFDGLDADVARAVGTPEKEGTLALERVLLAYRDGDAVKPLFPTGLDLVRPKDATRQAERLFLGPVENGRLLTSLPAGLQRLGVAGEAGFVEPLRGWMETAAFEAYLRGDTRGLKLHEPAGPFAPAVKAEDREAGRLPVPYGPEDRTSLMLDDRTGTASDGMLFTTHFTRLRPGYGLLVSVDNAPGLEEKGVLRLGAEQRPVAYVDTRAPLPDFGGIAARITTRFRLVLASPAPFREGWKPDFLTEGFEGRLGNCRVRMVAAAVGRYEHVGGWDLARNRPRDARRAVPAGSVYFLDLLDGDPGGLAAAHGISLFSPDDSRARQGLGLAFIGA